MSPETMQPVGRESDRELLRMLSSRRLSIIERSNDWNEVDETLRDWLFHGEDKSLAIHSAVKYGHPHLVEDNYVQFTADIDIGILISEGTLHLAAEGGYPRIVELLITHCLTYRRDKLQELISGQDSNFWTSLHWACQNAHSVVAEILLEAIEQTELDYPTPTEVSAGEGFTTPLHLAIKPSGTDENSFPVMAKSERKERATMVDRLLKSPAGKEMLNMKDWQGSTPLHLAVETMNVDVVDLLIKQPRLIATMKNDKGKSPSGLVWDQMHADKTKNLSSVMIIQKFLMQLQEVQEERETLIEVRARYYNAANALLVGGALFAQVSSAGILSMVTLPREFLTDTCPDVLAPSPSPSPTPWGQAPLLGPAHSPASSVQCTKDHAHIQNMMAYKPYYIRAIDVFRGSNNLSFHLAILTIVASIRLIISRGQNVPLEKDISRLRYNTTLISLALTLSVAYAVVAFISGGLANIPVEESGWAYVLTRWERGRYRAILKSTMLTTTMVGLILLIPFILLPLLWDDLAIFRAYLETKFYSWDGQHAEWAIGRWRRLLTVVLAISFLFTALFVMFMLIFGIGLLKDYIKLPQDD